MAKKKRQQQQQQQQQKPEKESMEDWVNSLAHAAAETAGTSKEERIRKRAAKKRRREERKAAAIASIHEKQEETSKDRLQRPRSGKIHSSKTKEVLSSIANEMKEYVEAYVESHGSRLGKLYQSDSAANKARNKKRSLDEETIQPRKRDYSGIGLARPSLFLHLDDPAVIPKLEEEFAEHIPGFFGKQRTKAMKKQMTGKMLWRQLADKKNADKKIYGKKLSEMTPDERVEAMIKAGMV